MMGPLTNIKYLRKLTRLDDAHQFSELKVGKDSVLNKISAEFSSRIYVPSPLKKKKDAKRIFSSVSTYADLLFLRHCCRILKRNRSCRMFSRKQISQQIAHILRSDISHRIFRTDISAFYDSIPFSGALALESVRACFSAIDYTWCQQLIDGGHCGNDSLPQGLSISGELAEHYMGKFDRRIINHEGVVFYGRFVDDIIVVTASFDIPALTNFIVENLPSGLKLNMGKTFNCDWGENTAAKKGFDFLGLSYRRTKKISRGKNTHVQIGIAAKKALRYKKRIDATFSEFRHTLDFRLLRDRIRYLTGGCSIFSDIQRRWIKIGLSASHSEINDESELGILDGFLGARIRYFSPQGVEPILTRDESSLLRKLSFTASFRKNIRHRFSGRRLWLIRKIYKYV